MAKKAEKRMALLIDADNWSGTDLAQVFDYLDRQHYQMPIRRAYGGHEKLAGMKDVVRQRAVRALVNQGKGTTDVALVVDAMDLLHSASLPPMVAIASSDADFAPLALRLREAGMRLLCFANRQTASPEALEIAYDQVVFLDEMVASKRKSKNKTLNNQSSSSVAHSIDTQDHFDAAEWAFEMDESLRLERESDNASWCKLMQDDAAWPVDEMPPLEDDGDDAFYADEPLAAPPAASAAQSAVARPAKAKKLSMAQDDPVTVLQILQAMPDWLPDTVQNLNQLGVALKAQNIKKGSKPLHELLRKHPSYFEVQPPTGPARQVKLLKALQ